jgi:fructokinase
MSRNPEDRDPAEGAGLLLAGVEAGGTKILCALARSPAEAAVVTTIPTGHPAETIPLVLEAFRGRPIVAAGIASFGPLDLDPASPAYGSITSTPKAGWRNADLRGALRRELGVPVAIDTDVNGAALAEALYGAGNGVDSLVYVTVGAGIGGGAISSGRTIHGLTHPEMGHITVRRHADDRFEGSCPYHGDCLEGLASGTALEARTGVEPALLPAGHPAWEFVSSYLAQLVANLVFILSPKRIILGGGVMRRDGVIERVRAHAATALAGYVERPQVAGDLADFLVRPALGDRSGLVGALELARQAALAPP